MRKRLARLAQGLSRRTAERVGQGRTALALVRRSEFFRNPLHRVRTLQQRLDDLTGRLRLRWCSARR